MEDPIKLIVAGTRTLDDYDFVAKHLDKLTKNFPKFELITGGCPTGADKLGEKWAWENWQRIICVKTFFAEWDKYGDRAGPIRNTEMVNYATRLVAFWDGRSKGTADVIQKAKKRKLKVKVIQYEDMDE